jgi:hypothetical protein
MGTITYKMCTVLGLNTIISDSTSDIDTNNITSVISDIGKNAATSVSLTAKDICGPYPKFFLDCI